MHLLTTRLKTWPKYYCTCSSNYLCVMTQCWYNLVGSDQLIKYHLYTKMSVYMQAFCIDSFPSDKRWICFFCFLRICFFVNLNSLWTSRWLWLHLEAVERLVFFFFLSCRVQPVVRDWSVFCRRCSRHPFTTSGRTISEICHVRLWKLIE